MGKYEELRALYARHGQEHVLQWYDQLNDDEKEELLNQLETFDLASISTIFEVSMAAVESGVGELEPITDFQKTADATAEAKLAWENAGMQALRAGRIAALVLGGGAGTRLGFDGPKGMYDIGLPSKKSLFQLFAERVVSLRALAGNASIPFIVMTSPNNHDVTVSFFQSNNYFGLPEADCIFFKQGVLPCLTSEGKLMMEAKNRVATSPDGNGGIYPALQKEGVISELRKRNVHGIHVFSVDNALACPADPLFVGFVLGRDGDCGNKSIWKAHPEEKLGVVAKRNGQFCVAEYNELDTKRKELRDEKGTLLFGAGNVCNHFFTLDFLENKVLPQWSHNYHVAHKKIKCLDDKGEVVTPEKNNGIKLECFIFDVFQMSERFSLIECQRDEEFAPVKNAPGAAEDSPDTARAMLCNLSRRWIETNGGTMVGDGLIEISPLVSYRGENLSEICSGKTFDTPFEIAKDDSTGCSIV
eukprot:GEMP01030130.1.p1 GENE.GEMP01030130.1~~GEMP01030130.1.p1  ORF type:complete len:473 (+),score=119.69 GEMP01030130.1:104-1522(+)